MEGNLSRVTKFHRAGFKSESFANECLRLCLYKNGLSLWADSVGICSFNQFASERWNHQLENEVEWKIICT